MVSKEIFVLLESNKIEKLYKKFVSSFKWMDEWSDKLIEGDILDENNLAFMIDRATGIFAKLCPVVNALESYQERKLHNTESRVYSELEKVKAQDISIAKSKARNAVSDIRDWVGDFKGYLVASQQMIVSAQSRIKRLVVEKGAKGVGYTGEVPVDNESKPKGW